MFQASDIYTTSGDVKLWNNWTQHVSKYDASSFYNWEQDNLPLYDIEERTYENWEQHGYPTSCVDGFALAVSADAPADAVACNQNLFTDVSSAIESLPQHLRFPVVIEVASFAGLEDLKLHNIKMGYKGSLEIINRNFSKIYSTSATSKTVNSTAGEFEYGQITSITSTSLSGTIAATSALSISTPVYSATPDARNTAANIFVSVPGLGTGGYLPCKLSAAIKVADPQDLTLANKFAISNYDALTTDTSFLSDTSATNQITNTNILRTIPADSDGTNVVGMYYGNTFDSISVKNCDGPIYIRGFCADGAALRENPISIENSNVFLEDCAAVRGLEAGVKLINSKVAISRGLVAYRNYGITLPSTRVSNGLGIGLHAVNSEVTVKHERFATDKYGRANSAYDASGYPEDLLLNFSRNNIGVKLENSVIRGGANTSSIEQDNGTSYFQCEHNSEAGISLVDSTMELDGRVDVYHNYHGIKSKNSLLKLNQLTVEGNTRIGYHGINSEFIYNKDAEKVDTIAVVRDWPTRPQIDFLQNGQNIKLEGGSVLKPMYVTHMPEKYGEFLCGSSHGDVYEGDTVAGSLRGQSPVIQISNGSIGKFVHLKGIRNTIYSNNNPGTDLTSYGDIVLAEGGSEAVFHGSKNFATVIAGPASQFYQYNKAGVCAKDNSVVKFSGPTFIGQYGVDILATGNSEAILGPPFKNSGGEFKDFFDLSAKGNHTSVELHSTRACIVADDGSIINAEDLGNYATVWATTTAGTPTISDPGSYNYGNFTPNVSAVDGGSIQFYPNPAENELGGAVTASGTDDVETASLGDGIGEPAKALSTATVPLTFSTETSPNGVSYNHFLGDAPLGGAFDNEAFSLGGMCVRLLNGSTMNVRNVHFLTGYSHAPSGVIYDVSAGPANSDPGKCNRLFMWNIDNTSNLNAELVSVSASYPGQTPQMADAGYHGPTAYWTSSLAGSPDAAFGCPSATPDTGSFSVLDNYGKGDENHLWVSAVSGIEPHIRNITPSGVSVTAIDQVLSGTAFNYGYTTHQNLGPFRLYFSVDPAVNKIETATDGYTLGNHYTKFASGGKVGPAKQLMSQGYSLSSDARATVVSGEPYWDSLSQFTGDRGLAASGYAPSAMTASGYYYTKDFVQPAFNRVHIDESAANLFANAKNAATGKSNRPKLVTIFDSQQVESGDDMSVSSSPYGVGVRSLNNFDLNKRN